LSAAGPAEAVLCGRIVAKQKIANPQASTENGRVVICVIMSTYELSECCGGKIMRCVVKRLA